MHRVMRRILPVVLLGFCSLLATPTHAVTYSSDVGVSFTFNTTLKVSLSTADLVINNLIPGTVSDSNIITINAGTNNATGLTMNATVGNSTDYNNRNLTHTSDTITSNFSSIDFGSSLSSLTTDNTWGYSYSTDNQSTWSDYSGLPLYSDTTNVATLLSTSSRSTSATGDAVNFKIAAKASATQDSGEYRNVVNFATVANPEVTGLLAISTMQQMTPEICAASVIGDEKQLIDTRDNKSYWVAKLADGKCWMTQNLDHDISTTFAYTPDNTDIPANWTPDKSTYPTNTTTWEDASTNGHNIQQSYDPGNKIWDGTPSSTSLTLDTMTQGTNLHYHIGNYYSWSAAVAMNNTASYTTQNTDVNQSICPKGWTLPKSGNITTTGSFQYLANQYNWESSQMTNPNIWSAPLYFPLSGYWTGSSGYVASSGYFWSSVVDSSSNAYFLYEDHYGYVLPVYGSGRAGGYSVRCVAREAGSTPGIPTLSKIETMQEMTSDICAATPEGTEKQLRDTRDNKTYWVAKLADGKCWMTQNLDHNISTTFAYTPDNTDIPANWTPDKSTYATGTTTWDTSTTGRNIQQSYDPGDKIWDGTPSFTSQTLDTMTQGTNKHYHLGNYYNWGAAVAMNDTSSYTTQNTDVNQSICPKGWTLPKSGNITTAGSFQYLVNQYNFASNQMTNPNIWSALLYFPLSGNWGGSSYNVASYGHFWSSVVYSSYHAYYLYVAYAGSVGPVDYNSRHYGYSVRCVSR